MPRLNAANHKQATMSFANNLNVSNTLDDFDRRLIGSVLEWRRNCRHYDIRKRRGNAAKRVRLGRRGAVMDQVRVVKGTTLNADEVGSWNGLADRFEVKRINHQEAYSLDGDCTNWAESYFARLRRGEAGHSHHIAGP